MERVGSSKGISGNQHYRDSSPPSGVQNDNSETGFVPDVVLVLNFRIDT